MSLSLAHELRQPLQAIQTASENISGYLQDKGVEVPEVNSSIDVIKRSVDRIDKHVQFLKSLGTGHQDKESFNIVQAIDEVVGVFRDFAHARGIELVRESAPDTTVLNNRATVSATLTNLVLNALEAIEGHDDQVKHHIRIKVESLPKVTKVRVEDDGPGIPEANRSRLFKRQTTSKQGGMGVGLYVWRDALQMFDSDLECESFSNPTTFLITMPR
jgi:signal transduction histidine kinase